MNVMYCTRCEIIHNIDPSDKVFRTGFRRLPGGNDIPIGICNYISRINATSNFEHEKSTHPVAD
jgi:hypothetical protein